MITLDITNHMQNTTAGIRPVPEVWLFVADRPICRAPRFIATRWLSNRPQ